MNSLKKAGSIINSLINLDYTEIFRKLNADSQRNSSKTVSILSEKWQIY